METKAEKLQRHSKSLMAATACSVLLTACVQFGAVNGQTGAAVPKPGAGGSNQERKAGDVMTNSIGLEFVWIPPGQFVMGSPKSEPGRKADEGPQRNVAFSKGFWMGRFEVTQSQWFALKFDRPPNKRECGSRESVKDSSLRYESSPFGDCPIETVSWDDAKEFVRRLNQQDSDYVYSLPSEAEWEYAARAGTSSAMAFGESLSSSDANFDGEKWPYGKAPKGPRPVQPVQVGSYKPNAWGLYDMHGNVGEWVEDVYSEDYRGLATDGSPNLTKGKAKLNSGRGMQMMRVFRGGAFGDAGYMLRSAARRSAFTQEICICVGFRVVARLKESEH